MSDSVTWIKVIAALGFVSLDVDVDVDAEAEAEAEANFCSC